MSSECAAAVWWGLYLMKGPLQGLSGLLPTPETLSQRRRYVWPQTGTAQLKRGRGLDLPSPRGVLKPSSPQDLTVKEHKRNTGHVII
ncbi:hypothetical protein PGTUg99_018217 [Puccinia graminis f. sp. tritici]|uniref:Uncharacterized protein n=1 Tax=Puccinia graminis f. sp. tritici TaxID=56615 RepID=A0A5B0SK98_PUCGR|nr:hypothetical protein PGTUg99_022436 [Puccinia graminis f. sp. tritici]KAA1137789.1 hypothetical protein PGTUg99_018217 [Puccinia graminis f. sp. tritici]